MTIYAVMRKGRTRHLEKERTGHGEAVAEPAHSTKPLPLKELQLHGFNGTEEHMVFIIAIMKQAPCLQLLACSQLF
ncbi:hypothetical protein ACP4OV_028316 [Aristida adscensionis]